MRLGGERENAHFAQPDVRLGIDAVIRKACRKLWAPVDRFIRLPSTHSGRLWFLVEAVRPRSRSTSPACGTRGAGEEVHRLRGAIRLYTSSSKLLGERLRGLVDETVDPRSS